MRTILLLAAVTALTLSVCASAEEGNGERDAETQKFQVYVSEPVMLLKWTPELQTAHHESLGFQPGTYAACGHYLFTFIPDNEKRVLMLGFAYLDERMGRVLFPMVNTAAGQVRVREVDMHGQPFALSYMFSRNGLRHFAVGLPTAEFGTVSTCLRLRPAKTAGE